MPGQRPGELKPYLNLLREIWLLTSDFPLRDEESEQRAEQWRKLLGEEFFVRHGKYVPYVIKCACAHRTWRGPIHADEFYRMFCKIVFAGEVWSWQKKEWIAEQEAIITMLDSSRYQEKADRWRVAHGIGDEKEKAVVEEECQAIIYGWEE